MCNCGGAEVTPEGKKLLSRFRTLEKELNKTADALLQAWREEDANL
jgi:molybdenum-dependent DNA-binding transcriptional regulator ModE